MIKMNIQNLDWVFELCNSNQKLISDSKAPDEKAVTLNESPRDIGL